MVLHLKNAFRHVTFGFLCVLALYAPGSQAQQRVCGGGSRGPASIGSRGMTPPLGLPVARGLGQFRGRRGPGIDVNPLIGQTQAGVRPGAGIAGRRMEGDRLGSARRMSWDQDRSQGLQRFPGQQRRMPGQGQMGFPDFPPMPSFGDQMPQSDLFPGGLSPEQRLAGQPNTFAQLPQRQGQRSFGGIENQRLGLGQTSRGQGQQGFGSQFLPGQSFQSGSRMGGAQGSFEQGQMDFSSPQASFGSQSFGSQTFSGQSGGGRAMGGQSFGEQSFSGATFGQLPGSAGGRRAPRPLLVEQPPITATSISQEQSQSSGTQPQSLNLNNNNNNL